MTNTQKDDMQKIEEEENKYLFSRLKDDIKLARVFDKCLLEARLEERQSLKEQVMGCVPEEKSLVFANSRRLSTSFLDGFNQCRQTLIDNLKNIGIEL